MVKGCVKGMGPAQVRSRGVVEWDGVGRRGKRISFHPARVEQGVRLPGCMSDDHGRRGLGWDSGRAGQG